MTSSYGDRLSAAVAQRGPLCVGIDPHPAMLKAWGLTVDAAGLERCARGMVEALGETVAVFKPQSAFFEAHGAAGIAVLERTLADIAASGALALLDVKRGDIGSTMDAYAAAYLTDGSPLAADAITLSPYLGLGSLSGAIDLALSQGRGVYVLALTSNPEGRAAPARPAPRRASGRPVDHRPGRGTQLRLRVSGRSAWWSARPSAGPGSTSARSTARSWPPGIGAQGAGPDDLVEVFGPAAPLVLPATSREVMAAGPDPADLQAATRRILGAMKTALAVG